MGNSTSLKQGQFYVTSDTVSVVRSGVIARHGRILGEQERSRGSCFRRGHLQDIFKKVCVIRAGVCCCTLESEFQLRRPWSLRFIDGAVARRQLVGSDVDVYVLEIMA